MTGGKCALRRRVSVAMTTTPMIALQQPAGARGLGRAGLGRAEGGSLDEPGST